MSTDNLSSLTIFGRSSSHFTRVTRIFAAELGVKYAFSVVRDLMSLEAADYAGNPALKLPALQTPQGTWFGALHICRELARHAQHAGNNTARIVWPEDLTHCLLANAQELSVQAMSTGVSLILAKMAAPDENTAHQVKMRKSLIASLDWLEKHVDEFLSALPADRQISYLEVTLYCLVRHLEFRKVQSTAEYGALQRFCKTFEQRPAAAQTPFQFDA